jgi:hypothetical protein
MKRGLILLTGLFFLSSSAWPADTLKVTTPTDETVEVAIPSTVHELIYPTTKSVWKTGKTYTIKWTSSLSGPVNIEINGGYVGFESQLIEIAASTANDGRYRWTIPSSLECNAKLEPLCNRWDLWVTHYGSPYEIASSGFFTIRKGNSSGGGYKICKTGSKKIKWSSKKMYYYVNTKGGPSGTLGAIKRGTSVWNRVKGSSFKFIYRGRTTSRSHGKYDGRNIVSFGPLKTGVLGVNVFYYTSNGAIVDSDIRFNTRERWSTKKAKNAYDLQSVAAHEFGHSLCLEDLYGAGDKSKTMYGYGSRGDFKQRTLHPADKRGIQALY